MTDKELVEGILRKEEKSVRFFVKTYRDMIYRTCLAYLQNNDDAEDLTQDIFIKIIESIKDFKGLSKLSTWIMRITINHALNAIRSKKISPKFKPVDTEVNSLNDPEEIQFEQEQLRKALNQAINSLPENQSKVFVLKKYHDLSYKEIATITGLTESAIESLLVRAKQGLQKRLHHFYRENYG